MNHNLGWYIWAFTLCAGGWIINYLVLSGAMQSENARNSFAKMHILLRVIVVVTMLGIPFGSLVVFFTILFCVLIVKLFILAIEAITGEY